MSLSIPNAPNAGLFKQGYNKYVTSIFLSSFAGTLDAVPRSAWVKGGGGARGKLL